jgi:uncharacterized membrane protein
MEDAHGNVIATAQANILPSQWDSELMIALSLIVVGFLVIFSLNFLAEKKNGEREVLLGG